THSFNKLPDSICRKYTFCAYFSFIAIFFYRCGFGGPSIRSTALCNRFSLDPKSGVFHELHSDLERLDRNWVLSRTKARRHLSRVVLANFAMPACASTTPSFL